MSLEPSDGPCLHLTGDCLTINSDLAINRERRHIDERAPISDEAAAEILRKIELHTSLGLGHLRLFVVLPDGSTVRVPPEMAAEIMPLMEKQKQADEGQRK